MSIHIVIDGYNLIRQSPTLRTIEHRGLEEGRDALLRHLDSYRKAKHHPVTVVFDGTDVDYGMENTLRWKGIQVRFSRLGESADAVIKQIVARERERIVVVSSDRDITRFASGHGATTMDSAEFEDKMMSATSLDMYQTNIVEEVEEGWTPTTKKKGPSRRKSKRQRKSHSRIRKL